MFYRALPYHYPMMDHQQFLHAFESASLTKAEWTHEAHLRMGWLFVRQYGGWRSAMPHVRVGIQRLNAAINHGMGYHETITVIFLRLIDARLKQTPDTDWQTFQQQHPDLFDYQNPVMLKHYSRDRLFSDEARVTFVEPDLLELPG